MRDGQITEESVNNMIRLFDRTVEILHKRNPQILQLHLQSLYTSNVSKMTSCPGTELRTSYRSLFDGLG